MPTLPDSYAGEDASQVLAFTYLYVIEHKNDGVRAFHTSYDKPVTVTGLPAYLGAADPQVFTPGQLAHSESTATATFEKKTLTVSVPTTDERIRRFFATGAAVKIAIHIIRVNSPDLVTGAAVSWEHDCCQVNSGIVGQVAFSGQAVSCEISPEALLRDESVPRFWFQRTCNHMLGHAETCGVNLAAFTHEAQITAADRTTKRVTLTIGPPGGVAAYFRAGQLLINETGERIGIVQSEIVSTKAVLTLRMWNPALTIGQTVFATAGCRHTTDDCQTKFANLANFGGFPFVPMRNPYLTGVV